MPRLNTLDRYVLREVLGPLVMGLGVLSFALVAVRLLKLVELVVIHGVTASEILGLVGYILPGFLELTLPMAVLLGVLLGFGRMASDRELTAARACGVSLYRLAVPAMGLALLAYPLASLMAFKVRPWADSALRRELYQLARRRAATALKEKIFNRAFPGLAVYVDRIEPPDVRLSGILISDARDPLRRSTIIARGGMLEPDEAKGVLRLRLLDGSIFGVESRDGATHVTSFDIYDVTIQPGDVLGLMAQDPQAMSYRELRRAIAEGRRTGHRDFAAETELARKYLIPPAAIIFAVLGVALGLHPARGGQSERFSLSLGSFFLYYFLMRTGQTVAETGRVNAFVAMSVPDLLFAAAAAVMFYRAATDRGDLGFAPAEMFWRWLDRLERRKEPA